jgi:hypothetical protein
MNGAPTRPCADPVEEAHRLLRLAGSRGLSARLLGGVAVVLSVDGPLPPGLQRPYKDLDFVTINKDAAKFNALLVEAGYEADERFNTLHGAQRLLHYDRVNAKQLDTFIDSFAMCHTLDLGKRLPADRDTLTPADLLLTKLQIVEVNDKDLIDSIALLLFHPISEADPQSIRLDELRPILRSDWGWYTTITDNLAKVANRLESVDLAESQKSLVVNRVAALGAAIRDFPKTLKWTMRSKVGKKIPWYDLPEEA